MAHPLHGHTLTRTVIVGVGSTGLRVLEDFQNYWFERFGNTSNSLIKLINIETDSNNLMDTAGDDSMITQIFVSNFGKKFGELTNLIRTEGNPLKKQVPQIPWEWNWTGKINWNAVVASAGKYGAGGIRAGGRLLLYGVDEKAKRSQAVSIYEAIKKAKDDWPEIATTGDVVKKQICRDLLCRDEDWVDDDQKTVLDVQTVSTANPQFSDDCKVYVVGALTGGTCSGMYIDLGYILQRALSIDRNDLARRMIGVFLIPPYDETRLKGELIDWHRVNANCFGSIYEFKKLIQKFIGSGLKSKKEMDMPYGLVYLVAPEYNLGQAEADMSYMSGIDGLTEMTALRLFTYCLGYHSVADGDLVDPILQDPTNYMFTYGTGAVVYPKFTLIQAGVNEILDKFCRRLFNEKVYNDRSGEFENIDESILRRHIEQKVDSLSDLILETISLDPPQTNKKTVHEQHLNWVNRLLAGQEQDLADELTRDFSELDGFYESTFIENRKIALKRAEEELNQDLCQGLKGQNNLVYVLKMIDKYQERLSTLKNLFVIQRNHMAPDILRDQSVKIVAKSKSLKSIDKRRQTYGLISELYQRFALYYQYMVMETLLARIQERKNQISNAIKDLVNQSTIFGNSFKRYIGRLDNKATKSPVVHVFFNRSDNDKEPAYLPDYSVMIRALLQTERARPQWKHFAPDVTADDFWNGILKGEIPYKKMYNALKLELGSNLEKYLHPAEGESSADKVVEFNIIDKVLDTKNIDAIQKAFRQIEAAFLKRKGDIDIDKVQHVRGGGRIPRCLISAERKENLERVKNTFNLDTITQQCAVYENPLMKDMLVFTRDIAYLKLDDLEKFEELKSSFLNHGFADMNRFESIEEANLCWTRLRLTLDGDVDYYIIEERKAETFKVIRRFLEFFWFDATIAGAHGESGERHIYSIAGDYKINPVPESRLAVNSKPLSSGCYIDPSSGLRRMYFDVPEAGGGLDIGLDNPEQNKLNEICRHSRVFNALLDFINQNTSFDAPDLDRRAAYIAELHQHFLRRHPTIADNKVQLILDELFSEEYASSKDKINYNVDLLKSRGCLIGSMMRIFK